MPKSLLFASLLAVAAMVTACKPAESTNGSTDTAPAASTSTTAPAGAPTTTDEKSGAAK